MCSYCPQKTLIKNYGSDIKFLTFDNYKRIIDNVPLEVQIDFSGFSEPFLNKETSSMIKYTADKGYDVVLYTTLVGFNDNDLNILSDVKFKCVGFHRYNGVGYNSEEFNIKRNIFRTKILKLEPLNSDFDGRVYDVWSRGGNLWEERNILGSVWCSSTGKYDTFDRNVVLPNGDVYICCMDYGLKHKIGNLFDSNFYDLNRDELIKMSNFDDSDLICRKCVVCRKK